MTRASELDKAIEKLVRREPGWKKFVPAPAVGARPGVRTTGRPSANAGQLGDLVESDYTTRAWWPEYTVETTDGVFSFVFEDVRTIVFDDGRKLELAQRPAP